MRAGHRWQWWRAPLLGPGSRLHSDPTHVWLGHPESPPPAILRPGQVGTPALNGVPHPRCQESCSELNTKRVAVLTGHPALGGSHHDQT